MDPQDPQDLQASSQAQKDTDSLLGTTPPVSQAGTEHRTIARDIAKLIKANKLSTADLKALDKDLRAEAIAFAETLEDESTAPLSIRKHALPESKPVDRGPQLRHTPLQIPKIEVNTEVKPEPPPPKVEPKPTPSPLHEDPTKPNLQSIVRSQPVIQPAPPPPPPSKPEPAPPPVVKKPEPLVSTPVYKAPLQSEDEIRLSLNDIGTKNEVLEKDIRGLQSEKNDLVHALEATKSKEKDVEEEEMRIRRELKEVVAAPERKILEEKRWSLEDTRQSFEKERWEIKQNEDSLDAKIRDKRKDQSILASKQRETEEMLRELVIKKEAEKARAVLADQKALHQIIIEKKKKYESDWAELGGIIQILTTNMDAKKISLDKANKEFEEIERKERATEDDRERHKLEEERWKTDKVLRETEKEIWAMEDELMKKLDEKKDLEQTFASIQIEEEDILEKLAESQAIIQKAESLR